MKFLTDEMLGSLTNRLRILGYDTIYAKDYESKDNPIVEDNKIIEESFSDFRILITKDKDMIRKTKKRFNSFMELSPKEYEKYEIDVSTKNKDDHEIITPYLLLEKNDLIENLVKISQKFKIRLSYDFSHARCSDCNHKLVKIIDKRLYKERIPDSVYDYHDDFLECSNEKCSKIYWMGGHFKRIFEQLKQVQEQLNDV